MTQFDESGETDDVDDRNTEGERRLSGGARQLSSQRAERDESAQSVDESELARTKRLPRTVEQLREENNRGERAVYPADMRLVRVGRLAGVVGARSADVCITHQWRPPPFAT